MTPTTQTTNIEIDAEKTPLEAALAKLAAQREANRAAAEAIEAARELARIEDEIRCEEALGRAFADPKLGPERVIGGRIEGAGCVVLTLPDAVVWTQFQDKGILKPNGLNTGLCDDLVCRCVYYPELPVFRAMLARNPAASVQLATEIVKAMEPEDLAMGKGSRRSLRRR
jgi:hypothetical protein